MVTRIPEGRFTQSRGVDNSTGAKFLFELDLLVPTVDQTGTQRGEEWLIIGTSQQQTSEFGHVFVRSRVEQCFFGWEIVKERSARNSDLGGDVRHRRLFITELFK